MCVCGSVLPWHKSLELSRGLVLLSPSVSVCRGEVFCTDDRASGGRREKVSHARVVWDGQKNKCCGIEGQRAACASCECVERPGGRDATKPLVHIICISAGPVTHYLRSASVK